MAGIKKDVNKKDLNYQRERDRQPVRGKFIFHEVPGGILSFNFHKYKDDPVESFTLKDGEIYTLPLGVAKHLNTNVAYPVHEYALDEHGKPSMQIHQKVRRCSFQSLEFMMEEDISPSNIVTAEPIPGIDK